MTKAEIVAQISRQSGIEKTVVMTVIESFMENVKESMVAGNAGSVALSSNGELKRRPGTFRRIRQLKFPLTISLHSNLPKHF